MRWRLFGPVISIHFATELNIAISRCVLEPEI